jgi:hypothetical protein
VSSTEFEEGEFPDWFGRLERSVPAFESRFGSLVEEQVLQRGTLDLVGTVEAEAAPLLELPAAREKHLELLYPAPMATADVVLVERAGREPLADLRRRAGAALRAEGWDEPRPAGTPSELPDAGVLDALQSRWEDVRP